MTFVAHTRESGGWPMFRLPEGTLLAVVCPGSDLDWVCPPTAAKFAELCRAVGVSGTDAEIIAGMNAAFDTVPVARWTWETDRVR